MDAKDEAYLEWLEHEYFDGEALSRGEEPPAPPPVIPVPMHAGPLFWGFCMPGYYGHQQTTAREFYRGWLMSVGVAAMLIVGIFAISAVWTALCWFVNGGIRGGW